MKIIHFVDRNSKLIFALILLITFVISSKVLLSQPRVTEKTAYAILVSDEIDTVSPFHFQQFILPFSNLLVSLD